MTSLRDPPVGFRRLYADQTEADHAALVRAAKHGVLPIESGV